MKTHKIASPLYILMERKTKADKKYYLNLNSYRNLHYVVNNKLKVMYKELLKEQVSQLPSMSKISLELILWKGSKRKIDRSNVCCIVEKFFCDALVELGKLEDDNDDFIISTKYKTGGVDKNNGRVEIIITEH